MSSYLSIILLVACPLLMLFMMRGMHGGKSAAGAHDAHGHAGGCGHSGKAHDQQHDQLAASAGSEHPPASVEQLRRLRDQLDREIELREAEERTGPTVGDRT